MHAREYTHAHTHARRYERQFSEVNGRIDKLSEALKRSAFASSRYLHAVRLDERQASRERGDHVT